MPTAQELVIEKQAQLKKALDYEKSLGFFHATATKEAAKKAVENAHRELKEAMAREKNPDWQSFDHHFPVDAKPVAHTKQSRQQKQDISNTGPINLHGPKSTSKPLAFAEDAVHQVSKKYYDPAVVNRARKERFASIALQAEAERKKQEAEQQARKLHAMQYEKEIDERLAVFAKKEKSFAQAILFNVKEGKIAEQGMHVENKPGMEDIRRGHVHTFNELQKAHVLQKKAPIFSDVPRHAVEALEVAQQKAQEVRKTRNGFFNSRNQEQLARVNQNRELLEQQRQELRTQTAEAMQYRHKVAAVFKTADKEMVKLKNEVTNERRARIFEQHGFGGETPEERKKLRAENRARLFAALSPRMQTEDKNAFLSRPKFS